MSYHYGFGVAITEQNIVPKSTKAVLELINMAPDFAEVAMTMLHDFLDDEGFSDLETAPLDRIMEVLNYEEPQCCKTIASVLAEVISHAEDIEMAAVCDDYTSQEYLVYIRKYPWNMSRAECDMTDITLTDTIAKYIAVISDVEPIVNEQNWQWCD